MSLEMALKILEKSYGKGVIRGLDSIQNVPFYPTGIKELDMASGIGGIPRGRMIEVFGPESSGKSTLSYYLGSVVQKTKTAKSPNGGKVLILDFEHTVSTDYLQQIGMLVDPEHLLVTQPDTIEQGGDIIKVMLDNNAIELFIWDSVAAGLSFAEEEKGFGNKQPGLHSKAMGELVKLLTSRISKTETVLVFINQLRANIGVMFGEKESTPGGKALKFFASMRIGLRIVEKVKEKVIDPISNITIEKVVGQRIHVQFKKNKVAPPFTECELYLVFGKGFNQEQGFIDKAVALGIFEKSSGNFSYKGEKLGKGKPALNKFLLENPAIKDEIWEAVKKAYVSTEEPDEDDHAIQF
jgi:recombination protein RecA